MTGARGRLHGLRVLIAEDEILLARVLIDLIELHGGTVAGVAPTEHKAREVIDGTDVNGAVLDIRLRSGSCFSLIEELTRRRIPVILTTGHTLADIPKRFENLPVFIKPFSVQALVDCLEQCRDAGRDGLAHSRAD